MRLGFLKKKGITNFSKLCKTGLVDLHSHILPAVDDGARDIDDSLRLLDGLAELGYTEVAATPHFNNGQLSPALKYQRQLIAQIDGARSTRVPVVFPAAEIRFDDQFVNGESSGGFPSLGSGNTYLVELGLYPGGVPPHLEKLAFQFTARGITLVLAHPERYADFRSNVTILESLSRSDVLLQLDLLSLVGRHGAKVKRLAWSLLEQGLFDLASSDIHRPADLSELHSALKSLHSWDEQEFVRLTSTNPRLVLEGHPEEIERRA